MANYIKLIHVDDDDDPQINIEVITKAATINEVVAVVKNFLMQVTFTEEQIERAFREAGTEYDPFTGMN